MAGKRLISRDVVRSERFLQLSDKAQLFYTHLMLEADDDGFINNPRKIQRLIGAGEDDCKTLLARGFLIIFESGVMVIRHWKIHNYIRPDRYKPTLYKEEKATIGETENKSYTQTGIPKVDQMATQAREGQEREGLAAPTPPKAFAPPCPEEVMDYCRQRQNTVDPQRFVDYYTSNGWMVGRNKMKDWKAAVRSWERKEKSPGQGGNPFLDMVADHD